MEYADLPIEPITQNQITQIALWRDSKKSPVIDFFIGCLNKFAVDQSQMSVLTLCVIILKKGIAFT